MEIQIQRHMTRIRRKAKQDNRYNNCYIVWLNGVGIDWYFGDYRTLSGEWAFGNHENRHGSWAIQVVNGKAVACITAGNHRDEQNWEQIGDLE